MKRILDKAIHTFFSALQKEGCLFGFVTYGHTDGTTKGSSEMTIGVALQGASNIPHSEIFKASILAAIKQAETEGDSLFCMDLTCRSCNLLREKMWMLLGDEADTAGKLAAARRLLS